MRLRPLPLYLVMAAGVGVANAGPIDRATCGVAPSQNLIVFVGQRLSIREEPAPPGILPFDQKFHTKYKVLELVCGNHKSEEIEFVSFDHYGLPAFADYETVLLYVSLEGGTLVHQKYQFQPVYETASGSWSGCGDPYQDEPPAHRGPIMAASVKFKRPLLFSVGKLSPKEIQEQFPIKYFRRSGSNVECVAGADVLSLFEVKRSGVLKARELFK